MHELGLLAMAHLPALLLMLVGFVLLSIEMYIPGFGLPGISGAVLLVIGIVLMKPSPMQGLLLVLIFLLLLGIVFITALRSFSRGRLSRSRLVLNEAVNAKGPAENESLHRFVGSIGRTHTALRPAGIGEFDGVKLNVVSDGDFIGKQRTIRVERVEGNRVVVRETDHEGRPVS